MEHRTLQITPIRYRSYNKGVYLKLGFGTGDGCSDLRLLHDCRLSNDDDVSGWRYDDNDANDVDDLAIDQVISSHL